LSDRGLLALEKLGLAGEIRKIAIPMNGRFIHNMDMSTAFQPYGKEGQYINSVSRADLNIKLMDIAEAEGVEILFNEPCTSIDWKADSISFENNSGKKRSSFNADIVFAADGAYSIARLQHMLQHDRFEYQQSYIDYGYKELHIPAGEDNQFKLEKNALHIWPRGNFMLIALPNPGGSFTCTLFFPFEGELSFESINSNARLRQFFEEYFTDALPLMPTLEHDFFINPTSSLVTVKCFPWIREDKFALIGDAAHAIVPFFGQGMNCGFEDCYVLDQLMEKHQDNWQRILAEYQELRKPDADAIAELALNNFIEMRDKVADPKFLLQKKIEARLHEKYPGKWIPAYSQVTFSPHIRYSEALRRGNRQEEIMKEVMAMPGIESKWESEEIEKFIMNKV
jgi:kynurenine 3-monooxygenase